MTARAAALTTRQRTVLATLINRNPMSARRIGVRSDVLWRMEERGLVRRSYSPLGDRWSITTAGRDAIGEQS